MSEIVNLRQIRKRRAREAAEAVAAGRRAQFGRAKTEREAEAQRRDLASRALDGHRLAPDEAP